MKIAINYDRINNHNRTWQMIGRREIRIHDQYLESWSFISVINFLLTWFEPGELALVFTKVGFRSGSSLSSGSSSKILIFFKRPSASPSSSDENKSLDWLESGLDFTIGGLTFGLLTGWSRRGGWYFLFFSIVQFSFESDHPLTASYSSLSTNFSSAVSKATVTKKVLNNSLFLTLCL